MYYTDLSDERVVSTFAMVHSRFSTNKLGAWHLAHRTPAQHTFKSDANGRVSGVFGQNVTWRYSSRHKRLNKTVGEKVDIPADLVLIAIGFTGTEAAPFVTDNLTISGRGSIAVDERMQTNLPGVFAAGDANMGQSIVVWAIGEGRDVARAIDIYLAGDSQLPPSLRTSNLPIDWEMN